MNLKKRRLILKEFVNWHFGYFPIIWMFHNRTLNNRINRIREWTLRIFYRDKTWDFTMLLQKDNAVIVHQRILHFLAPKLYKVKISATQLLEERFPHSTQACNSRLTYEFKLEKEKTVHDGTKSLSFLDPKLW